MARESMQPDERLWAAIRLEKPDRVPVLPTLLPEAVAGLSGLTQAQTLSDSAAVAAPSSGSSSTAFSRWKTASSVSPCASSDCPSPKCPMASSGRSSVTRR